VRIVDLWVVQRASAIIRRARRAVLMNIDAEAYASLEVNALALLTLWDTDSRAGR